MRSIHRVLVVDDDESLLRSYKRSAGRSRTVLTATHVEAALHLARTEQPELAIVDMRLGSESGIELIRELKRIDGQLLVALVSGYLSVTSTVSAVRAGADTVVFKPTTFDEILRRLDVNEAAADLDETPTLARAEWEHIMRVLDDCNGNVSMAARRLGIYRSSLQRKLRKYAPQT